MAEKADSLVLELIVKHDRPFNVQMIADFLATKGVKKAQAQRSMENLATSGKLRAKEYGKSKIYFPVHNEAVMSKEEMAQKQAKVKQMGADAAEKQEQVNRCKQELSSLTNALSNAELQEQIAKRNGEIKILEDKLEPLKKGQSTVSLKDYEGVNKILSKYVEAWQKRKRIFNDVWGTMAEGMSMKEKDVFEDAGVDTDEQISVSLRDFSNLVSKKVEKLMERVRCFVS